MLSVRVRKQLREFPLAIAFEARPAETLVIIGPSGCGKTTTLNLIAGLVEPDEGRIALGDRCLWDRAAQINVPAEKRQVGYVFQDFALFPHMTVADNVMYGLRCRGASRARALERAGEVLDLLGIGDLRHRRPAALSGGERQRVALARAIACDAEILLLDEPLGSLDAQTRNRVRGELHRMLRLVGQIAIMVTHDYIDALTFGDQICVLDRGQVLQIGSRDELLRRPKSQFVAELTGVNFFAGRIERGPDGGPTEVRVGDACFHAVCDDLDDGEAMVAFFPSDVTISRERPATSARNVFRAHVREIIHLGGKARVALDGSLPMCAEVAADTIDAMGLAQGDVVYASVKASAIKTYR